MKFLILSLLVFAQSAFGMSGTLEVTAVDLRVKREDGMKVHFYPGKYKTEIDLQNNQAWVRIERNGITTDAIMKYPTGTQIPATGRFLIDGTKTGQTFLLEGDISTAVQDSAPIQDHEACTYYQDEWVCEWYQGQQWCHWKQVQVAGWRDVEFFYRTRTVDLKTELRSDNGGKASFSGRETSRSKIYTYKSRCY